MAFNSNVVKSYQTAEYGKFVELVNNSMFPPVSVTRWSYPDTSSAFPQNSAAVPLSSVDIYPKYATLTYLVNADDIKISLSGDTSFTVDFTIVENLIRTTNTLLNTLTGQTNRVNGFVIPDYNRVKNYYYTPSNNISRVDYKFDDTIVASLSFTYFGSETDDDALLAEVIKIA